MQTKLLRPLAAFALVALAGLGSAAHARDNVFFSVGVEAAPGVTLGVTNARPVVVAPAPVYVAPAPVYVAPRPVYVAPQPVVLAPAPVYYDDHPGKHKGWHKKHHRHHRHHHHHD
jgi:hypothetical protein